MTADLLRWRPVSDRAIEHLVEQLRACVDVWLAEWWSPPPQCQVRCIELSRDEANEPLSGTALPSSSPWVDARTNDSAWDKLTQHALGLHEPTAAEHSTTIPADVLTHVSTQIVADLVDWLHPHCDGGGSGDTPNAPCEWRNGGLCLEFETPKFGRFLTLRLAHEYFWPPIASPRAAESTPVPTHAARDALQDSTVDVRVSLGACRLSANEVLEMSPGDLLMLPSGPNDELGLHLLSHGRPLPAFARGVLGRTASRFALQLTRMEPMP